MRVLVVGRQQHGITSAYDREGCNGVDPQRVPHPEQQHHKSRQRGHERECNPCKQKHEQYQHHRFQRGDAADLQNLIYFVASGHR